MIDRVLCGECPGMVPIVRVFQPELVVNLAVAHDIGIRIPPEFATNSFNKVNRTRYFRSQPITWSRVTKKPLEKMVGET
jgi:hypothetical protein